MSLWRTDSYGLGAGAGSAVGPSGFLSWAGANPTSPPAADPRRFGQPEQLLDAGREHRRPTLLVVELDVTAARHLQPVRGFALDGARLLVSELSAEEVEPRPVPQVGEGAAAAGEVFEQ